MQNLLHAKLSISEIAIILESTAGRTALPTLGAPIWKSLRTNPCVTHWLTKLTALAKAEAHEPLPPLTDELYQDFFKTGTRLPFEQVYFERRRRLSRAAIAMLLGDTATQSELLPSFLNKLTDVFDEGSWTLPAHVWENPSGKDPMHIDLFAAECANNFADMLVVFAAVIPVDLATRIRTRLRTHVFENYLRREPPFGWTTITNNWNAVCHQGVLGAALAIENDHHLVAGMLARAAPALPHYLAGFGEDGSTSEGPGYWSYGFGWFSELNAQLEHRTDGQLSLFADDSKIARIARFAPQMTLSNGQMVNFSDGNRNSVLNPSLLTYLGQRLGDETLEAQGTAAYRDQIVHGMSLEEQRSDFFNLTRMALRAPTQSTKSTPSANEIPDVYFPDYGAIVARGTDHRGHLWEFAAKGGNNAEHHNHNDCGSWMLNIDGIPAVIEIGAPEYTHDFFNENRYTFLAARSLGHSVPFVNSTEQSDGETSTAKVLHAQVGEDRVEFIVDLTQAYPIESGCIKLHRCWVLEKSAGQLTVTDTYELKEAAPFESILITSRPTLADGLDAVIPTEAGQVRIQPNKGTRMTAIETCDYRGHHGTDEQISRIRLSPTSSAAIGSVSYLVRIDASLSESTET